MFPPLCRLLYVPVSMLVCNLLSSLLQSFQEWQVSVSQQYIFLDLLVHRILIDIIIVIFVIVKEKLLRFFQNKWIWCVTRFYYNLFLISFEWAIKLLYHFIIKGIANRRTSLVIWRYKQSTVNPWKVQLHQTSWIINAITGIILFTQIH